jgi:hypothetical protein
MKAPFRLLHTATIAEPDEPVTIPGNPTGRKFELRY